MTPALALDALAEIDREARAYLADAMRQPGETYPPIFATYVVEGVPITPAKVSVDTALVAIGFAIMGERARATIQGATDDE